MRGPMLRIPAYDPFAIAVLGCGVLLAASLLTPITERGTRSDGDLRLAFQELYYRLVKLAGVL
jgi:hypothetical protein